MGLPQILRFLYLPNKRIFPWKLMILRFVQSIGEFALFRFTDTIHFKLVDAGNHLHLNLFPIMVIYPWTWLCSCPREAASAATTQKASKLKPEEKEHEKLG